MNSTLENQNIMDNISIIDLIIDDNYSNISDIHYELKEHCNDLCNGLFYHSNEYDFINLLKSHIVIPNNYDNHSESDDDNYEISDI